MPNDAGTSRMNNESGNYLSDLSNSAIKAGVTGATIGAIIFGHITESSCRGCPPEDQGLVAGRLFFTLLAIDLVPILVYALAIRRRRSLNVWGLAFLGLSAAPWLLGVLANEVFLMLVYLGYPILLVGSIVVAVNDYLVDRSK